MNVLKQTLDSGAMKDIQIRQYANALYVEGSVPKAADGGSLTATISISNLGDFLCQRFTGNYTSLIAAAGGATAEDDGVNHLSCQIRDGGNSLELFDDFIPLDLFLTPGRRRFAGVTTGAGAIAVEPAHELHFPGIAFEYLFSANSEIVFAFRNDSDWINKFQIALWGIRMKASAAVKGLDRVSPLKKV